MKRYISAIVLMSTTLALFIVASQAVYADPTPTPNPVGEIILPPYLQAWIDMGGGAGKDGGALIFIFGALLRLVLIGAGFFALWQFISAGYTFMNSAGDPQKLSDGRNKLLMALVGLAVIASSFVIAGLVGVIFFQDAMAILQPTIVGAPS